MIPTLQERIMMNIDINLIRTSAHPIRSSFDEARMEELAQSIREQGILVPLLVRPMNGAYELVDGHRRFEAARRVGLSEVPINPQEMSESDAMAAALIAELQREDASPLDRARALRALMDAKGWNTKDVERAGIMRNTDVSDLLRILKQPKDVQELFINIDEKGLTPGHIRNTYPLSSEPEYRSQVMRKAGKEGLSVQASKRVSESVKHAPTPQAKQHLIETPYSPYIHDPEYIKERAESHGPNDPFYKKKPEPTQQQKWDTLPEAKVILNRIKATEEFFKDVPDAAWLGKVSPEGQQFIARKLRRLAQFLNDISDRITDE